MFDYNTKSTDMSFSVWTYSHRKSLRLIYQQFFRGTYAEVNYKTFLKFAYRNSDKNCKWARYPWCSSSDEDSQYEYDYYQEQIYQSNLQELEEENNRRKDITLKITNDALYMVKTNCDLENENAIVLGHKNWHAGVIGIVASRIKETFARPAIIMSLDDIESKGSCRSIRGFDMVDALRECKEFLTGFGGHPIAAGLSMNSGDFNSFKKKFIQVANDKISTDDLIPTIYVDSILNLEELNSRMIKFLNAMEPYGPGNMRPVFVTNNLSIDGIPKLLGRDQNTLKFSVKQNKTPFESIGFNMAEHYEKLIQNAPIDIAYVVGENYWNGQRTIQLELKDIKLSKNYA